MTRAAGPEGTAPAPPAAGAPDGGTNMSQALGDALAWRTHKGRSCAACDQSGEEFCGTCAADWTQADRYHELARALGAVDDWPTIGHSCGTTDPG